MRGGYYSYLQSFDPRGERRFDANGEDRPVFIPYQQDPAVVHRDRFRAISNLGKPGAFMTYYRLEPQPVDQIAARNTQRKPDRPQGGKLLERGYLEPGTFSPKGFGDLKGERNRVVIRP